MFEPFSSDFKKILKGSSFLGLRSSVFVLYPPGVINYSEIEYRIIKEQDGGVSRENFC